MIVGAVCMSHSPLMDRGGADAAVENRFRSAVAQAASFAAAAKPDLTIVFHPDHLNGFFYGLLPAFCVGIAGRSVGDYGTGAGPLDIPAEVAGDCAAELLRLGIDTALSHRMTADHGAVQPLELLSAGHPPGPMLPVFINCAAPPLPGFPRVRALGAAIGAWAAARPERVLIVGSGGLSHDPPLPALATAPPELRARLVEGGDLTPDQREARQERVYAEGERMAAGSSDLLPPDPGWDRMLLDAFQDGDLAVLDGTTDAALAATGGRGGHEVRCWIAALAALGPGYAAETLFYEPVDAWITGMGVLTARPA
ncbi:3-carboxyethylcatechol 2,3-dioxygenase [Marinibaculum pumilum]|uniref:3-carboxyethylcatechol 2,3-dioxygenase n=1 Tax=Marinibaculum pumilum TaxID=1766165 RepID=A0ABV7KZW8_9PROT